MSQEKLTLRGENLVKMYGQKRVVKGVSVEVEQGQIIGLLGPNGAGKTTTFYMIVGLVKPTEGGVFLDKDNITKDAMYRRAQKGIGYLAQEASIFRKLSVEDNIMGVLEMMPLSKKERKQRCDALIEEFSLEHVRNNRGDLLSGGERRRTEIARALAVDPKFILLDEPFAGVDPIAVEDIQKIVRSLVKRNIGILITDHNVQQTLAITDKTYIMFEGNILKEGTPEELADDPDVRRVYLGENFQYQSIADVSEDDLPYRFSHVWFGDFNSDLEMNNYVDYHLKSRDDFSEFIIQAFRYDSKDAAKKYLIEEDLYFNNDQIDFNNFNSIVTLRKEFNTKNELETLIHHTTLLDTSGTLKSFDKLKYVSSVFDDIT